MDSDTVIEDAYHAYAKLLSTLPHMDTQELQFLGPLDTEYVPSSDLLVERKGPQALDPAYPASQKLLMTQADGRRLFSLLPRHSSIQWQEATHSVLLSLQHLDDICCGAWASQRTQTQLPHRTIDCGRHDKQEHFLSGLTDYTGKLFSTPVVQFNQIIVQLLCVALLVQFASYMSQGSLEHLLMLLGYVIKGIFPDVMSLPKTLHQLLKWFSLTPIFKEYACCPSCFALYDVFTFSPLQMLHPFPAPCSPKLEDDPALQHASLEAQGFLANSPTIQNEHLPFPYTVPPRLEPRCTYRSVHTAMPCNAHLAHDKGQGKYVPLCKYVVLDIFDYLARLHACPQFEEYLEQSMQAHPRAGGGMEDVMDGSYLSQLKDCHGGPWRRIEGHASHLTLALFVDWFQPHSGKHHEKTTVGGIYLICLDLPPHLRYKSEYIFMLANIPGPHEPVKEQLNHLLDPIVDHLLELYLSGIWLTRTFKYMNGRHCFALLLFLITDRLGAQKVSGLAAHNSKWFCYCCRLPRKEIHNIDIMSWPQPLTTQEHGEKVKMWLEAKTLDERRSIFDQYGFRFSALSRLPYFSIIHGTPPDPMHIGPLGNLVDYGINILGLKGHKKSAVVETDVEDWDQTEALGTASDASSHSSYEGHGSDACSHGGTPEDVEMEMNFDPGVGQHLQLQDNGAQELEEYLSRPMTIQVIHKVLKRKVSLFKKVCARNGVSLQNVQHHGGQPIKREMLELLIRKV